MAYTFLKTQGKPVGKSLVEDDKLGAARDILERAKARGLRCCSRRSRRGAEAEAGVPPETLGVDDPRSAIAGLDIGRARKRTPRAARAHTVVGTAMACSKSSVRAGTIAVAQAVASAKGRPLSAAAIRSPR